MCATSHGIKLDSIYIISKIDVGDRSSGMAFNNDLAPRLLF